MENIKFFYRLLFLIISIWTFSNCTLPKSVLITDYLEDELNNFQYIIEVNYKIKEQLYLDANEWFVSTFTKSDEVIEFRDKEAGKISGKYVWGTRIKGQYFSNRNLKIDVFIRSTVFVDIKDGKVRIRIENPLYKGVIYPEEGYLQIRRKETAERVLDNWENLVYDFEKALKSQNDIW